MKPLAMSLGTIGALSVATLLAAVPASTPASAQQNRQAAQLTAAAPDLVPIPSRMSTGTVSVRNAGTAASGPSLVAVVCQKVGGGSCAESPQMARYTNPAFPNALVVAVPALAPNKVFNFKLPFWNSLVWVNGNYRFTSVADAAKTVAETNEGNNKSSAMVHLP